MTKGTKIGLIIALVGLFIPILTLPFTANQRPRAGLVYNISHMKVVLREGQKVRRSGKSILRGLAGKSDPFDDIFPSYKGRIEFPYKYCFFAGSVLVCGGLCIALAYYRKKERSKNNPN